MIEGIDHVAIVTFDLEQTIQFYEKHFGFRPYADQVPNNPQVKKIVYLRRGDDIIEVVHMAGEATPRPKGRFPGADHIAFRVRDFDGEVARLKAAGVQVHTEPHPTPAREPGEEGWKRAAFRDNNGTMIEIRGK